MSRVLIVEGRTQGRLASALRSEGLDVLLSEPAAELVSKAIEVHRPNVVILETTSIDADVSALCTLCVETTGAPVVIFAERPTEREVIMGFAAGAHTIFGEPVGSHELVARVRAVLRRSPVTPEDDSDVLLVGPIMLDRARHQLTVDRRLVPLPRKEFEIAAVLMRKAGLVVPRRDLVQELWGAPRDTKSLDVQVGRLRNRLAALEGFQRIVTVRGVGYRLLTGDLVGEPNAVSSAPARS